MGVAIVEETDPCSELYRSWCDPGTRGDLFRALRRRRLVPAWQTGARLSRGGGSHRPAVGRLDGTVLRKAGMPRHQGADRNGHTRMRPASKIAVSEAAFGELGGLDGVEADGVAQTVSVAGDAS